MSTSRNNIKNIKLNRFAQIAKLGITIFHAKDLANLWQIKEANTLYTTLTRYVKQGLLYRIYKGFYALKPINELNPLLLGLKALHEFSYISTETVLSQAGVIFQSSNNITLISSKSKKFNIGNNYYCSRQLADKFLFNSIGIKDCQGIKIATTERAVADLLYFNAKTHFDAPNFINWKEVKKIQKNIGYPFILKHYDSAKFKRSKT